MYTGIGNKSYIYLFSNFEHDIFTLVRSFFCSVFRFMNFTRVLLYMYYGESQTEYTYEDTN